MATASFVPALLVAVETKLVKPSVSITDPVSLFARLLHVTSVQFHEGFTPRSARFSSNQISLFPRVSDDALERAKRVAPGYDVHALKADFLAYWDSKGRKDIKNPDAAFLGFCKACHTRRPMRAS